MEKAQLADYVFSKLSQVSLEPQTELEYNNNFTLAVAVILSAQATDIQVNKATKSLFYKHNTPEAILALGLNGLKKYVRSIGLYNSKAENIIKFCEILIRKHNSKIPDDFDMLIALPGIGRKTANVILNCAFGYNTIAVDTHVFRVSVRLGLSDGKNPLQVERDLITNIPSKWLKYAHHWLILHGRYVCVARKPKCESCPLAEQCNYYNNPSST